jgi:hypothetical protein
MSTLRTDAGTTSAALPGALLLSTLIAAIFLSAALLFAVEPMFTKMVLPRLGGTPQVWSVAMVFFQTALLAGYGYAHLITRYLPGRPSIVVQLALLVIASFTLPLSIASGFGRPPAVDEAFWLLGLFAASIGLPFFALAANAPLLQAWFARSGHPSAGDPYFLYAASNVGSFLALLAYPLAIEPLIRLGDQTRLWSIGFYVLILLIAASGRLLWSADRAPAPAAPDPPQGRVREEAPAPTWRDPAAWTALAAVPSGLLIAVTAHISTDVAAVPLFWVVPLALYLLTFVIVFSRRVIIPHNLVLTIQPFCVLALVWAIVFDQIRTILPLIALHVGVFFVCALACHGELARRRPAPRYLTSFYMWMSAGGVIGGISAGLLAPYVFNWVAEYPILLALSVLCRPGLALPKPRIEQAIFFGAVALAFLGLLAVRWFDIPIADGQFRLVAGVLLVASAVFFIIGELAPLLLKLDPGLLPVVWRDPLPVAAVIAFVLIANHQIIDAAGATTLRSFFGVYRISESSDGRFRLLTNGTTLHGGERIRDESGNPIAGRPEPIMYYYSGSAIAQVLDAARAQKTPIRYAVIGLGTGSLACSAERGDTVHYYEIDPTVIRIASNPENFTFLRECAPVPITLGDARLTLADAPDGSYDAIIVDAFTSDAIPIHLLTREAMEVYRNKLSPHGIVGIHISNRHLELASVVAGIAAANGMVSRLNESGDVTENSDDYIFLETVVAAARSDDDFGPIAQSEYWEKQEPDPDQWVWTDDYCNIIGAILRKLRG